MEYKFEILGEDDILRVKIWDQENHLIRQCDNAWSVLQTARHLGKSKRHIYRFIQGGSLRPLGKFLGEWLFDPDEVRRFQWAASHCRLPLRTAKIPLHLQTHFPEYNLLTMNPWANAPVTVSRILEGGTREDWKWIYKTFPKPLIRAVVQEHGSRLLSPRSHSFWRKLLKIS